MNKEDCELYHALTMEMAKFAQDYWSRHTHNGVMVVDAFPFTEDPSKWIKLDHLPTVLQLEHDQNYWVAMNPRKVNTNLDH